MHDLLRCYVNFIEKHCQNESLLFLCFAAVCRVDILECREQLTRLVDGIIFVQMSSWITNHTVRPEIILFFNHISFW